MENPKEEPNYNMKQETLAEMERLEEEPKQETLVEAALNYSTDMLGTIYEELEKAFAKGAKWQQERSYNEEEVLYILKELEIECVINPRRIEIEEWFEQFKKK